MKCICKASDCENVFSPTGRRLYCSDRCKEREKKRVLYAKRKRDGLCTQCGGKMDYPSSSHSNKEHTQYCYRCKAYFAEKYQEKANQK